CGQCVHRAGSYLTCCHDLLSVGFEKGLVIRFVDQAAQRLFSFAPVGGVGPQPSTAICTGQL
ncbi:hypothetical protein, partial [Streptococcus pneumoniae]|uniref:hypothetical protein n=1 Tax=Streptococcus pneumoniae TaxID=1313 RepID=UPI001E624999